MEKGVTANPQKPFSERNGKLLTTEEAADYLAVKPRMVTRLTWEKKVTATYIGKLRRYALADLDAYIEAQRRPAERS